MRVKATEAEIQKAILEYLAARGIFAGRINTGGGRRIGGVFVPATHTFGKGTADILAFPHSNIGGMECEPRPCWIECKRDGEKQTADQVSFQRRAIREGHGYLVAHSIDDVANWLKDVR